MADDTAASTFALTVDDASGHDLTALLTAMECARRATFDAIAIPPEIMRGMKEPSTMDIMRLYEREAMPKLFGMQVVVSRALEGMRVPVRRHKKRRNQSEAYHRRIQKKWTKRFGTAPAAVLLNPGALFNHP